MDDIHGISLTLCIHRIFMEEGHESIVQPPSDERCSRQGGEFIFRTSSGSASVCVKNEA